MGRQHDQVHHLPRCIAFVHVVECLVIHELDCIAEVGEILADVFFSAGDWIGAMDRHQVFGIESPGNLQAIDVIQWIPQAAASHGRDSRKCLVDDGDLDQDFFLRQPHKEDIWRLTDYGNEIYINAGDRQICLFLDGLCWRQEA